MNLRMAFVVCAIGSGCVAGEEPAPDDDPAALYAVLDRRVVVDAIRARASARGITNPLMIAGIAWAETNLTHCRADYVVQQCRQSAGTPVSNSCAGGSVLVGNADPSCDQGGLGLFQIDFGTQRQTIAHYGARVLELSGNIDLGIDHILNDLRICSLTPSFGSDTAVAIQRTIAWLNGATRGTADYNIFFTCMSRHYNGAGTVAQANYYRTKTDEVFARYGNTPPGHPGVIDTEGAPLTVRAAPNTGSTVLGSIADGTTVSIRCQKRGEPITGTFGTSDLWDDIGNGFVADAFVRTGSDGQVAPTCN